MRIGLIGGKLGICRRGLVAVSSREEGDRDGWDRWDVTFLSGACKTLQILWMMSAEPGSAVSLVRIIELV